MFIASVPLEVRAPEACVARVHSKKTAIRFRFWRDTWPSSAQLSLDYWHKASHSYGVRRPSMPFASRQLKHVGHPFTAGQFVVLLVLS
jgi:hypothetical protein